MTNLIPIFFPTENAAYIAVGLSQDDKMGDDSVVECVYENGRINAYTSWTNGKTESTREGVVSLIF